MSIAALFVIVFSRSIGTHGQFPLSEESRVRSFLLNQADYSSRDRPVFNSNDTVEVTLELSLYAMIELNEKNEFITTASWCTVVWNDPRLRWDPLDYGGVDLVIMYNDEIWTPKIQLSNSVSPESVGVISPDRGSVLLTSNGSVNLGTALIVSTYCRISIRYFPFDYQVCTFLLTPENQFTNHVKLTILETVYQPPIATNEWDLVDASAYNSDFLVLDYLVNRPELNVSMGTLCVRFKRDPRYYLLTLVLPSILLSLLAFVTFLAPTDSGERISLGVSMVLGLTVFQLVVLDTLPAASKDTPILGKFLQINFALTCLAVPLSVGNINIAYGDNKLPMMKWAWFRRMILETLPRRLELPTYKERVRMESAIDVRPMSAADDDTAAIQPSTLAVERTPARKQIQPISIVSTGTVDEELSPREKAKLEARTVALVLDRLVYGCFLVAFISLLVGMSVALLQNPGASSIECPSI